MPRCSICKEWKSEDEIEEDICLDCASSKIQEDDLNVGRDDFS